MLKKVRLVNNAEVGLSFCLLASLGFHFISERTWTTERKRLTDALISKNVPEFMSLQRETKPVVVQKEQPVSIYPEGL